MTDNEIIKALECCKNDGIICFECPYKKTNGCMEKLSADALDLITRQQAEIENLKVENQSLRGAAHSLKMHYEEAQSEINKLNAENMLTMSERNAFRNSFYELSKQLKTAKSEAVKEYAEKLKGKTFTHKNFGKLIFADDIDDLVKEMVGEKQ